MDSLLQVFWIFLYVNYKSVELSFNIFFCWSTKKNVHNRSVSIISCDMSEKLPCKIIGRKSFRLELVLNRFSLRLQIVLLYFHFQNVKIFENVEQFFII